MIHEREESRMTGQLSAWALLLFTEMVGGCEGGGRRGVCFEAY